MKTKITKTHSFNWKGTNNKKEQLTGIMEAASVHFVRAKLKEQGIIPKRVRKNTAFSFSLSNKIVASDITLFSRQLATMIKAGIPMVQAFSIAIEGQTKPSMHKVLYLFYMD